MLVDGSSMDGLDDWCGVNDWSGVDGMDGWDGVHSLCVVCWGSMHVSGLSVLVHWVCVMVVGRMMVIALQLDGAGGGDDGEECEVLQMEMGIATYRSD